MLVIFLLIKKLILFSLALLLKISFLDALNSTSKDENGPNRKKKNWRTDEIENPEVIVDYNNQINAVTKLT